MTQIGTFTKKTDNNYQQTITKYQAQNCEGCPLRGACHKQTGNRIIEVNMNLRLHKQKIREKLNSEEGIKHRKQRPQDVEATFGQIKSNHNFKRLRLKGLVKVEIEVGLAEAQQEILCREVHCAIAEFEAHRLAHEAFHLVFGQRLPPLRAAQQFLCIFQDFFPNVRAMTIISRQSP